MIKAILLLLCLTAGTAGATVYYSDPVNGSMDNDGSYDSPWGTFKHVLSGGKVAARTWSAISDTGGTTYVDKNPNGVVTAGDTIMLRNGHIGRVVVSDYVNRSPITVMAQPGHSPSMTILLVAYSANWIFDGFTISPELETGTYLPVTSLIDIMSLYEKRSHSITIKNCTCYSVMDASGWSEADWNTLPGDGAHVTGTLNRLENCTFKNVDFGITVSATNSMIRYNTVENFAGDGMRALGSGTVFEYNTVKNCYDVNANHDDGIQSWNAVHDVVLRGNFFLAFSDINQPFRGTLQGIGVFDGSHRDWIVENNVVMVDHWHGITIYGCSNCRIINNTVGDLLATTPGPPWIDVSGYEVIRNNLATRINQSGTGVDHNIIYTLAGRDQYFVDPEAGDYRLKPDAPAVDAGSAELAPAYDRHLNPRPFGAAVDVGAFEYAGNGREDEVRMTKYELRMTNWPNPATLREIKNIKERIVLYTTTGERIDPAGIKRAGMYLYRTEAGLNGSIIIMD